VFAPQVIQGRWLGAEDLEALQRLIAEHPHWSRRRLSIELCEALNWRTASGQLKDMSARLLLNKLAERGFIKLPPRQRGGGRQILRALSEPELFSLSAGGADLIEGPLRALQPLEVIPVEPRTTQANAFICHLAQHHYLGYEQPVGEHLKYIVWATGRPIACMAWSSAPRHLGCRDRFIGWSPEARRRNIRFIAYNTRFLIVPWVEVPHLASHILGRIARVVSTDWEDLYKHPIYFLETFVDPERFRGTCYYAANWQLLGETTGRGKDDQTKRPNRSIKQMLGYPLTPRFRELLEQV